ncbi:hypothetical protein CTAYLR_001051 [Chrysophaeum taylorii]|uniref:Uncharacterized protein n=1 Tax=Chrysophaeum taylorii TaxID=2483200 RepID=A0AAD7UHS3_9STRA|nr:hypothetical protein CTAYLR_001051 [Chrysophaeum taylorii]
MMEKKKKDDAIALQYKIRENAMRQSEVLQEMSAWEKDIRKRDKEMRQKVEAAASGLPPVRRGGGRVVGLHLTKTAPTGTAAGHTHDKGYAKWDRFDVDAELSNDDRRPIDDLVHPFRRAERRVAEQAAEPVPPIGGDAEAAQRELGNKMFANGDYAGAVKSYTVCLGLKKRNSVALSNRAMAYLKLKEFHNAEADCTSALGIDPTHVKSLHRRAAARDALGKHRAALADVQAALKLEPSNKALAAEALKIRQHLRACFAAAPLAPIS